MAILQSGSTATSLHGRVAFLVHLVPARVREDRMRIRGPVLAATALDPAGDEVIRQAAAHATAATTPLIVCHVVPEMYAVQSSSPNIRESDRAYAEAARRGISAAAEEQMRRAIPDMTPTAVLRIEAGSPHTMVLQAADELGAGLVVVGAGANQPGGSLSGVAERIIRHAQCSVLTLRRSPGIAVLAATDFSDPALPAIEAGKDEARRSAKRFVAIHAVEVSVLPVASPEAPQARVVGQLIDSETRRASTALHEITASYGPGAECIVGLGPPADEILEAAAKLPAELIVVGTHGRSGFRRLTLGSVAESVLRRAHCSVLVVRLAG